MQVTEILYSRGYRLGPRIGKGSYAKVKVTERLSDNKIMASKIISRRRAAKEFLNKFLPRELSVILSLRHRNIIQVYEIVQTEEVVCIMMEYASRGDLLDYIKRHGVLHEDAAGLLFAQVCEGINYLHSRNICHRDLKCENILLRRNMTVALSDFGFSRSLPTQDTLSSTYCGSAAYASPELLRGTPYRPLQNDIWSLGCIIFIMVTGQMPFCDKNTRKMVYRQLKGKVNFPDHRNVSMTCKSLITSTLEPNTDLRYDIKAILSHPWLQPFVHLVDTTLSDEPKQPTTNSGSNYCTTELVNTVRENVNSALNKVIRNNEVDNTTTENKDTLSQSIYYKMLFKKSSLYLNDSINDNSYSCMCKNTSLCRMPGEACIFRGIKKRDGLLRNEDQALENVHQILNISDTNSDQKVPSESSVGPNRSNSSLLLSTSIDNAILLHPRKSIDTNQKSCNQEISMDTTIKTGDKSFDQNFKIKIQQILQIPFNKTNNPMPFQDHLISPSSSSVSYRTSKRLPGSKNVSNSTNVNLTQSNSMTQVHKQSMFFSNANQNVVKQMKHDITVEQVNIYQARLVTQMRRIFESKNASTSTNDHSSVN